MPSLESAFQFPPCDSAEIPEQPRPTCTISGISFAELYMTHDMFSSSSPSSAPASTNQGFMATLRHAIREDVAMIVHQEFEILRIWLEMWDGQHPRTAHEKDWGMWHGQHPRTAHGTDSHSSLCVQLPSPKSTRSRVPASSSTLELAGGSPRLPGKHTRSNSSMDLRCSRVSTDTTYRQPSKDASPVSQFDTMMEPNFGLGVLHKGHTATALNSLPLSSVPSFSSIDSSQVYLEKTFEAAYNGDLEQVRIFLDSRGDPNAQLAIFEGQRRFTDCSLLPIASMSGDIDIVHMLMDRKANVHSKYGFPAGARGFPFIGSSTDAALSKGDLELLKVLFFYRADPYASSSNGATLVWQSCYFGHLHILAYLLGVSDPGLSPPVSHSAIAESQDIEGVSFSPLHIATLQGHIGHVEMLLKARADPNIMNEQNRSPLIDAISCCRPEVLRILISYGADLVCTDNDSLGILFKQRNPVLVHAAAMGLQQEERQVRMLSTDDVLEFLQIGNSDARRGLFEAILRERSIICRGTNQEKVSLATALLQKSEMITGKQTVDFINVVESSTTSSKLLSLFYQRQQPTLEVKLFLDKLLPGNDQGRYWLTNLHLTSIRVFESIVPEFHKDLRILRVIKNSSSFDPILETLPVRAIIQVNWQSHVRGCVCLQVALSWCLLLVLILAVGVLTSCHGYRMGEHGVTKDNWCGPHSHSRRHHVIKLAWIGLFIIAFDVFDMILQFHKRLKHGWLLDYYWHDIGKFGTLIRVGLVSFTFVNICFFDFTQLFDYGLRILLAIACFLTWVDLLIKMTPFRTIGFFVTPILFTMRDIISFVVILCFFLFGFAHAFISMCLSEDNFMPGIRKVFLFGMEPEFTPREVKHPDVPTVFQREIITWILMISVFMMPIALMNTFIAAMVNSYTVGRENSERLYQGRLASCVFDKMSVYLSLKAFLLRFHGFWTTGTLARPSIDSTSRSSLATTSRAADSLNSPDIDTEFLWYCFERKD